MPADVFIDTNVVVYHLDATDRRKHALADRLIREALASGRACISFQVVQECLNTVLRHAKVGLTTSTRCCCRCSRGRPARPCTTVRSTSSRATASASKTRSSRRRAHGRLLEAAESAVVSR